MDKLGKKFSQNDLRRLMAERKTAQAPKAAASERIVSPLAKYDPKGNLSCVICRTNIKSATLWKVHINSKQHKQNVIQAKELKEQILLMPPPASGNTLKQQMKTGNIQATNNAKDITALKKTGASKLLPTVQTTVNLTADKTSNASVATTDPESVLPESFFDDPVKDAKVRNVEYKDAQDEEWNRFQREIKEESATSNVIIAGEQTNSAVEREIVEINEQLQHWTKVLDLEQKVEKFHKVTKRNEKSTDSNEESYDEEDGGQADKDDDALEDLLNWRSKSFK